MAKVSFTTPRVNGFTCPPEKKQAFLWDATAAGLGLRATPAGKPAFIFQAVYQGKDIRLTIGSPENWTIPKAQEKARELQRMIDEGKDPRDLKRDALAQTEIRAAEQAHQAQQEAAQAVTVGEAWQVYIEARKDRWGALHLADHNRLSAAGGVPRKRGKGLTVAGPLHTLMAVRLVDLSASKVTEWAETQALTRPTPARLSWRLLRAFLTWCSEQPEYAPLVAGANAAKTKKTREALGKPGTKKDALQREQLPAWFTAVRQIGNPAIAAYLQAMLLTGARPSELLALRWEDVNLNWKGLTIHDKVEGERVIPLTPYVHNLIAGLPKRGEWVFAGATKVIKNPVTGEEVIETQALTRPAKNLADACTVSGVDHVSLHGLRRSFKSLTEWLEIPAGVVAQLMGHKPSATAEKHYTVRPLDLLRVHHEKIEAWILKQAGIVFDAKAKPGKLRVVAG
jgi:integrase